MAANIREEIRRLHRRKQLHFNPQASGGGDSSDTEAVQSGPSATGATNSYAYNSTGKENPLFTFRQVRREVRQRGPLARRQWKINKSIAIPGWPHLRANAQGTRDANTRGIRSDTPHQTLGAVRHLCQIHLRSNPEKIRVRSRAQL